MKRGTTSRSAASATAGRKGTETTSNSSHGKRHLKSDSSGSASTSATPLTEKNLIAYSTSEACHVLGISRTTLYKSYRKLTLLPVVESFVFKKKRLKWPITELRRLADDQKDKVRQRMADSLPKSDTE